VLNGMMKVFDLLVQEARMDRPDKKICFAVRQ
jgi:hypothetical protein